VKYNLDLYTEQQKIMFYSVTVYMFFKDVVWVICSLITVHTQNR